MFAHMKHNLNSLRGSIYGSSLGVIKGEARSLDYDSHDWLKMQAAFDDCNCGPQTAGLVCRTSS